MADTLKLLEEGFQEGIARLLGVLPELDDAFAHLTEEAAFAYGREGARRALAPLVWLVVAGEVLTTEQVRELLGISRQALHKRVEAGTILAAPGEKGRLYPVWQFVDNQVRPVVREILAAFRGEPGIEADPLTILSWSSTRQPELDDQTPSEWIRAGRPNKPVVLAAERAARTLRQ